MFTMTYEVLTPESASEGDVADRGYCDEYGNRYDEPAAVSLRAALRTLSSLEPDCSDWAYARSWREADGREDYRTGAVENRSIHLPDGITPSSRARINRLIKSR